MALGAPELLILLAVLLLLFGAKKLPELARSAGASIKEFRNEVEDSDVASPPAEHING